MITNIIIDDNVTIEGLNDPEYIGCGNSYNQVDLTIELLERIIKGVGEVRIGHNGDSFYLFNDFKCI